MKAEFPVLDSAIRQGKIPDYHAYNVKLFDIQNVADIFMNSGETGAQRWDEQTSFGPLTPPFPDMWIEFELTWKFEEQVRFRHGVVISCFEGDDLADFPTGGWEPLPEDNPGVTERGLTLFFFNGYQGRTAPMPCLVDLGIDANGRLLWRRVKISDDEAAAHFVGHIVDAVTGVVLLALGMLNCKNVTTETRMSRPRGGKKTRRQKPSIEYRVIKLPEPRRKSNNPGERAEHPSSRLHVVRGHFKTYTAEKPLMGHVVGTYWWSYHARGNPENGQVISTYQVGANA